MGGETYTQREDFFFPYLLPGARGWPCLHPLASSSETPLIGCVSHARLWFSALCLNLTAWFSSRGLLPVTHLLYSTVLIVLSYPCLLITAWQLVKAHGVTRNEPKIHAICYITCGAVLRKKTMKKCPLKAASVFSAEIFTINLALKLVSTSNTEKFIIHSDSIS